VQSRINTPDQAVTDAAIDHAVACWRAFAQGRGHDAHLPKWGAWEVSVTPDGAPLVSGRVDGPAAVDALAGFASMPEHWRPLAADDLRPVFTYGTPGRVTCVWRTVGVWVEVWRPEPAPGAPASAQAPSRPPADEPRRLPGARLPFTRTSKPAPQGTGVVGNPAKTTPQNRTEGARP
jgi:hypothetical protein